MSTVSMSDVFRRLNEAQQLLDRSLEDVLSKGFTPDAHFKEELRPYMSLWGKRTLHDFMVFCTKNDPRNVPNLQAGQIQPYNPFLVMLPIYKGS